MPYFIYRNREFREGEKESKMIRRFLSVIIFPKFIAETLSKKYLFKRDFIHNSKTIAKDV